MQPKELGKVLIIGQNFESSTGGGITLSNLFSCYPKEKLAVVTGCRNSNFNYCNNVYVLRRRDKKYTIRKPDTVNGYKMLLERASHDLSNQGRGKWISRKCAGLNKLIMGLLCKGFKVFFHQQCFSYSYLSRDLNKWINEFNPDLIYTQLGSIQPILLFEQIRQAFRRPYVIHFMDDWFQKYSELRPTGALHQLVTNQIKEASSLLVICQDMANEYKTRFNCDFHVFHNPVDIEKWRGRTKADWSGKNDSFIMLFAGNLGEKGDDFVEFCQAIHDLCVDRDLQISFHVYTNDYSSIEAEQMRRYKEVSIFKFVSNNVIMEKMMQADVLLLLLSLEEDFVRRTNLSMPTKASEYMISGTPILVYAHSDSALNRYAKEYKWGYVVSERNRETIKKAILDIYMGADLRRRLGETAIQVASEHHDIHKVSKDFAKQLNSFHLDV